MKRLTCEATAMCSRIEDLHVVHGVAAASMCKAERRKEFREMIVLRLAVVYECEVNI